jgi:putative acetyltransferase
MNTREVDARPFNLQDINESASECERKQARELLLEYGRFVITQPGAARFCFANLENEAARIPHSYIEQGGGCLMALAKGNPAGFITWRTLPSRIAPAAWELKRLWVRPTARGLGLGRALTQTVILRAVAASKKSVYLDTAPASMAAAHHIYLELGFEPCPPYNDNPVEGLVYLRKIL